MPIWCRNRLEIFGFDDDLDILKNELVEAHQKHGLAPQEGTPLTLHGLNPIPAGVEPTREWLEKNWLVTSDVHEVKLTEEEDNVVAWNFYTYLYPPMHALYAAALRHPQLEFTHTFVEAGFKRRGMWLSHSGLQWENSEGYSWETIPEPPLTLDPADIAKYYEPFTNWDNPIVPAGHPLYW